MVEKETALGKGKRLSDKSRVEWTDYVTETQLLGKLQELVHR